MSARNAKGSSPSRSIQRSWHGRARTTTEAEAALTAARAAVEQAEHARAATAAALASARDKQATANSTRARLAAETQALAEMLAVKDGERWPPMIDSLTVADGLEAALGAVLGEELTSALESRGGAALAGTAGVRSGTFLAGLRDAAGGIGARTAGSGAGAVADWSGRKRPGGCPTISPICSRASLWSPVPARSGGGTAIPSAPARRRRRRCGCSSAIG